MTKESCITKIRDFMLASLQQREIGTDDDIFSSGIANSLFAIQLVDFVERSFGITIEPDDLELDNFRTIERIAALIERKQAVAA